MTKKEGQQLIGLEILKSADPTLGKRALGRRAKERKLVFGRGTRHGLLTWILDRMKRPR